MLQDWKLKVLKQDLINENLGDGTPGLRGYKWIGGCLVSAAIGQVESRDPIWHGSSFQGRVGARFSTTEIETAIMNEKLQNYLDRYLPAKDSIVLDAGSADGRVTHSLLQLGYNRIIATDLELASVVNFYSGLSSHQHSKILPVVEDINNLPLADEQMDGIIAWGLFTATPDFEQALASALKLLKPQGLFISAEPLLEHALIYSLVRQDPDEFERIAQDRTRARMWDQKDLRYRIYSLKDLDRMMSNAPLKLIVRDGISIFPSLIYGGVLQDRSCEDVRKEKLREIVLNLKDEPSAYRQVIYVGVKD